MNIQQSRRPAAGIFQTIVVAALIGFGVYFDHASTVLPPVAEAVSALTADLARERASAEVRQLALWAVDSHDHAGLPFVVVDKAKARLFAFDQYGRLRGSTAVLSGSERRDGAALPATAGRFVADAFRSAQVDGIVWVNEETAVSLHASGPEDKRASGDSLHVDKDFYRDHLSLLKAQVSIAYVLPDAYPPVHGVVRASGFGPSRRPA